MDLIISFGSLLDAVFDGFVPSFSTQSSLDGSMFLGIIHVFFFFVSIPFYHISLRDDPVFNRLLMKLYLVYLMLLSLKPILSRLSWMESKTWIVSR